MAKYLCMRWRDLNDPTGQSLAGYSVHADAAAAQIFVASQAGSTTMVPAIRGQTGVGGRIIDADKTSPVARAVANNENFIPVKMRIKDQSRELKQLHQIFKSAGSEHKLPLKCIPFAQTRPKKRSREI